MATQLIVRVLELARRLLHFGLGGLVEKLAFFLMIIDLGDLLVAEVVLDLRERLVEVVGQGNLLVGHPDGVLEHFLLSQSLVQFLLQNSFLRGREEFGYLDVVGFVKFEFA